MYPKIFGKAATGCIDKLIEGNSGRTEIEDAELCNANPKKAIKESSKTNNKRFKITAWFWKSLNFRWRKQFRFWKRSLPILQSEILWQNWRLTVYPQQSRQFTVDNSNRNTLPPLSGRVFLGFDFLFTKKKFSQIGFQIKGVRFLLRKRVRFFGNQIRV